MEPSASIFSHKGSKMAVRRRHSSFLKGTELLNWFTKKQLYTQHFFTLVFHHFSLCKCFCLYFFLKLFSLRSISLLRQQTPWPKSQAEKNQAFKFSVNCQSKQKCKQFKNSAEEITARKMQFAILFADYPPSNFGIPRERNLSHFLHSTVKST